MPELAIMAELGYAETGIGSFRATVAGAEIELKWTDGDAAAALVASFPNAMEEAFRRFEEEEAAG